MHFSFLALSLLTRSVLKIESDGQLEVQLNGATLLRSPEHIVYHDINLWPIKSSITFVDLPGFA